MTSPVLYLERPANGGPARLRLGQHVPAPAGTVPELLVPESGLEPGQIVRVRLVREVPPC